MILNGRFTHRALSISAVAKFLLLVIIIYHNNNNMVVRCVLP